jgi:hypothetical protein
MQWYIRSMHALRISVISAILSLVFGQCAEAQQGLNNLWLGGFEDESPPPWGGVDLNFLTGNMVISTATRTIDFKRTNANITECEGNLLFSTNGAYLANALGDTLLNGTGLNPSAYTSIFPEGLHISQACLILPKPEATGIYCLVHSTIDEQPTSLAHYLYLTIIDMSLDGGLGGVVIKNQVLISDTLNVGKITAVRHANGRDWWVVCHKVNTNIFYRLLLTPAGVSLDGTQSIGVIRPRDVGQVCYSPDGSKFAYYWGQFDQDLEIFDFDRCTGLFSDPVQILISDANTMGGVAFSPNGRYLYVSSVEDVYQYDTEAPDIAASMVHIAEWDGFYSPFPPFATLFDIAQLAPDGKVYISTGNGTQHLHVIHNPDEPGVACNMEQHSLELPRYFMNSLPNHPNYHLGPIDGSVCDSLGITVNVSEASLQDRVRVQPNPSNGAFGINYPAHAQPGLLEVLDATGRVAYQHRLSAWSTVHQVDLAGQPAGMYHCRLSWGTRSTSVRVILQP